MKPCHKYRKLIAWLALDELDVGQARNLRTHFETCAGCRAYMEEISSVTNNLTAAEPRTDVQASESFHHRLIGKLRAAEPVSIRENALMWAWETFSNWRVAVPVIAAFVVLIGVFIVQKPRPVVSVSLSAQSSLPTALTTDLQTDPAPTIANYTIVANQSLEKLDELLTRQANQNPLPTRIYTASTLTLLNAAN